MSVLHLFIGVTMSVSMATVAGHLNTNVAVCWDTPEKTAPRVVNVTIKARVIKESAYVMNVNTTPQATIVSCVYLVSMATRHIHLVSSIQYCKYMYCIQKVHI